MHLGLRAESNANAASGMDTIDLNGLDFELDPASRARADQSVPPGLQLHYRERISRHGDMLRASLSSSANQYPQIDRLDSVATELRVGPDFALDRFGPCNGWLSLHATAGQVRLDARVVR